jgi:hypothetical protein
VYVYVLPGCTLPDPDMVAEAEPARAVNMPVIRTIIKTKTNSAVNLFIITPFYQILYP